MTVCHEGWLRESGGSTGGGQEDEMMAKDDFFSPQNCGVIS